jgi:hypothetical protein
MVQEIFMGFTAVKSLPLAVQLTDFDELSGREVVVWSASVAWLIAGVVWLSLFALSLIIGWAQKKEAHGSFWRLLWVSALAIDHRNPTGTGGSWNASGTATGGHRWDSESIGIR